MKLLCDVYNCMQCHELTLGFARRQADKRFFRFPPVIGATRNVSVLFSGINPRITPTNEVLHQQVSGDLTAFADLAANRIKEKPYIAIDGKERHYRWHARMISDLFPNRPFEEVAAATELYFCASTNASGLDRRDNPCAKKFMERVFILVQPRVVIAVGKPVEKYLRQFMCGQSNDQLFNIKIGRHTTTVVPVPHPNARDKQKLMKWERATAAVESALDVQTVNLPQPSIGDEPILTVDNLTNRDGSDIVIKRRTCKWHDRYGWKPFQRPADLDILDTVPGARIEFHLTRNGKTQFILSMTAGDWKTALGRYYNGPNWRRNGYAISLTRSCGGQPVPDFVDRWKPYIRNT